MKTTILTMILIPIFGFTQNANIMDEILQDMLTKKSISNGTFIDMNKQVAFNKFQSSNVRINLGYQLREFNYELISTLAKKYKIPMSKMIIFNNLNINGISEIKTAFKGADNPLLCEECYYLPYKLSIKK